MRVIQYRGTGRTETLKEQEGAKGYACGFEGLIGYINGLLPAPLFEKPEGSTRTVLFAHQPLTAMDKADRVRACYLHACLCYVTRREMTNTTLRARFGVEEHNRATVSRFIREAVDAGVIVAADPA